MSKLNKTSKNNLSKDENKVVSLAIEYIEENYTSDIVLDDVSNAIGYNKFYLCRAFKKTKGTTVQKFIFDLRMERAKSLLVNTDGPLTEIVYMSGFSSQSYFCQLFKKVTNMTPLEYRKIKATKKQI